MIPTYAFVFIAVVLAIILGRAGTILREYFEARSTSDSNHMPLKQQRVKRLWRV